ncbi:hypothetical protein ACTXG6_19000 [Pseudonocardia sp. Cha107L01]|uniref:hypothetical protein n=1 Tax=Pseudonocardia sp. Cha107L01 TaxID=3457576 RepID=UPI00403E37DE
MSVIDVVRVATPFVWVGAVLAISFLETPLKFRAPGITVPLGLGIGRLVFRALNIAELALAVLLSAAMLASAPGRYATAALIALWVLLLCQTAVIRPRLDRRTRRVLNGERPARSPLHLGYVALELIKVAVLLVLGALLTAGVTS